MVRRYTHTPQFSTVPSARGLTITSQSTHASIRTTFPAGKQISPTETTLRILPSPGRQICPGAKFSSSPPAKRPSIVPSAGKIVSRPKISPHRPLSRCLPLARYPSSRGSSPGTNAIPRGGRIFESEALVAPAGWIAPHPPARPGNAR